MILVACGASPGREVPSAADAPARAGASNMGRPSAGKLVWSDFDQGIFAKAKAERRFVVLDGAAEWCHFCHVMEEKTYADPRVRAVLERSFIAAKVDVDARPDIEERYGDWGWPATVIFSPDGEELGKYRGYIPPEEFLSILEAVVAGGKDGSAAREPEPAPAAKTPLASDALDVLARFTELELEEYWDAKEGGWGKEPKVPLGWNTLFALSRAKAGDARLREHALVILEKQKKLIDPVWGGIYQYSVAPDWDHPHYEKLMSWNSGAMASYAEAFALTRDAKHRAGAESIRRWLDAFMVSPDGTFYATQDADLNSHAASVPFAPTSPRGSGEFLSGEHYYKLGDAERRARGVPRIDPNEYADDNGLGIFAYSAFAEATGDATALATATRAAEKILAKHRTSNGGLTHLPAAPPPPPTPGAGGTAGEPTPKLHLSDAAAFGFGLVHLGRASNDARWRREAEGIADFLRKNLYDKEGGGFFSQTRDDNAVGVFRVRRKPFEDNVLAMRFMVALDRAQGSAKHREMVEHSLRAISTPDQIKARWKFLGDYLSLIDEVRAHRTLPAAAPPTLVNSR